MSPARVTVPRRKAAEWGVRLLLAAVALFLAGVSLSHTMANVIVRTDPLRARALANYDGQITAAAAQQEFVLNPGSNPRVAKLARLALQQDPTAANALTVLGFQAQFGNDIRATRRLFTYSLALTRRELQPRLWAIEEAVQRGDINAALRSYDLALRTSRGAPDLLFPVLTTASSEPKVRVALIAMLQEKPVWLQDFLSFLTTMPQDSRPVVSLFLDARGTNLPITEEHRNKVVNALVLQEYYQDAWNYYVSFHPNADRRFSRDPRFTEASESHSAFDWSPSEDGSFSANIVRTESGSAFEFSVPTATGGVLLQQWQALPPGTYQLTGRTAGIDQSSELLPYWTLTCIDERELGRVMVTNSAQAEGRFSGRFTVPTGCDVQRLSLVARASDQISGLSGQVLEAFLGPAGMGAAGASKQ